MKVQNLSLLCACSALLFTAPLLAAETHTNSIGMEFVKIPAGSFLRGTPQPDCDPNFDKDCKITDEMPQRDISISSFWLGKYEVTQEQWVAVMGENPSLEDYKGRTNPVSSVSWKDVQAFIQKLNAKEGHNRYRLPTEAEWEYAARAGSTATYSFGDDPMQLEDYAWYNSYREDELRGRYNPKRGEGSMITVIDIPKRTLHPVGQKQPNSWGLYDMHGNVGEWVNDLYQKDYYAQAESKDPQGPVSENTLYHVLRGCAYDDTSDHCRITKRQRMGENSTSSSWGFRLALSPEQ